MVGNFRVKKPENKDRIITILQQMGFASEERAVVNSVLLAVSETESSVLSIKDIFVLLETIAPI